MESALNEMRLALSCSAARKMQVKRKPLKALGRRVAQLRLARSSSRFREPHDASRGASSHNPGNAAAPANSRRSPLHGRFCGTRENPNHPDLILTRLLQTVKGNVCTPAASHASRQGTLHRIFPNPTSLASDSAHVLPQENFHNGCWCCVHCRRRRDVLNDGRGRNERHCGAGAEDAETFPVERTLLLQRREELLLSTFGTYPTVTVGVDSVARVLQEEALPTPPS